MSSHNLLIVRFFTNKGTLKIGPKGEGRNKDGDRTTLGPSVHPPNRLVPLDSDSNGRVGARKRKAKAKKESRCCEAFQVYNTKDTLAEREREGGRSNADDAEPVEGPFTSWLVNLIRSPCIPLHSLAT